MKRLGIFLLSLLVVFAITAFGVEKKEKDKKPTPASQTTKQPDKKPVPKKPANPPATTTSRDAKGKPVEKKYDTFVDANHNGIDDRRENLVKK